MSYRHGFRYTSEYGIWSSMKQRCLNPKNSRFEDYGGRGIFICQPWAEDFLNFYRDMGPRPSIKHTIERKNNDDGYYKENCKWELSEVQQLNTRRKEILIEIFGGIHSLRSLSKLTGIKRTTLLYRYSKLNLRGEDLISKLRV